jgi:hypothetical protein
MKERTGSAANKLQERRGISSEECSPCARGDGEDRSGDRRHLSARAALGRRLGSASIRLAILSTAPVARRQHRRVHRRRVGAALRLRVQSSGRERGCALRRRPVVDLRVVRVEEH